MSIDHDTLVAMHPYYVARAVGGLLFLLGAMVGAYNVWMTVRTAPAAQRLGAIDQQPVAVPAAGPALQPAE